MPTAASPDPSGRPAPADRLTGADPVLPLPAGAQEAVVDRHIDGDTLALRGLAAGPVLSSTSQITVRLLEIDTPETKQPGTPVQCYGPEASARLAAARADRHAGLRRGRPGAHRPVRPGPALPLGRAGRQHQPQPGRRRLCQGRAVRAERPHITVLRAAESAARTAERGLWGACPAVAPAPPPAAAVASRAPAPIVPAPAAARGTCDPAYPSVCIRPPLPDLDCGEIPHRRFAVLAPDPHGFDGNSDGVGCESG